MILSGDELRAVFGGRMTQAQVDGCDLIVRAGLAIGWSDPRWFAYALATAAWETGRRMQPVREGFALTDRDARLAVATLHRRGRISVDYAKPDPATGLSYYGRGLVQITHKANYERVGKVLGLNLVGAPDRALDPGVSARILVIGMELGLFVPGHDLARYFSATADDPIGARRIVNGVDQAGRIAELHRGFLAALRAEPDMTPDLLARHRTQAPQPERPGPVAETARTPPSEATFWATLLDVFSKLWSRGP